jgi:hypothetical protein
MHLEPKQIEAYLEHQTRKLSKTYDSDPSPVQMAGRYGVAVAVIWELIMDLDPDVKAKHIKKMKVNP